MHRLLSNFYMLLLASSTLLVPNITFAEADYQAAKWDPIHFKPAIDQASNEQCLTCHSEIIERTIRQMTPAGLQANTTLAWYQTLDTYDGAQETFHRRHLETPYSKKIMNLSCNTCHQGNDPREESAHSSADGLTDITQRKMVDPEICLMCHGQFNNTVMGIPGSWIENSEIFGNSCMTCHATIRTNRHQVNYLKPEAIETMGQQSADACFGCHGGRAWYMTNYSYARHDWPLSGGIVPDWAKDRPTESDSRFLTGITHAPTLDKKNTPAGESK